MKKQTYTIELSEVITFKKIIEVQLTDKELKEYENLSTHEIASKHDVEIYGFENFEEMSQYHRING